MNSLKNIKIIARKLSKTQTKFHNYWYSTSINQKQQQIVQNDQSLPSSSSPSSPLASFPGAYAPFTTSLNLNLPDHYVPIPIYKVMDRNGNIDDDTQNPKLDKNIIQKMYKDMLLLNTMDKILYESQRQGRISFYMTNYGEEASHIGSAAALHMNDLIYAQYREAGLLVWRGFTISEFIDQCYGNYEDEGKGKQMPVHYGSKRLNFVTISSPLATQMPQSAGAAYALKRRPNNQNIVVCYFGDGAASEGDAHAAFNFAATLECPLILFCRNNGYAISTPVSEQYKSDGIASRGPAYGIATIRVDGTDVFAVYNATKLAREYAFNNNKPVLIEAMSYRVGHHSTSDDSTAYRSVDEIEIWNNENPINKLKNFVIKNNLWNEQDENDYIKNIKKQILSQISMSEKKLKPDWKEMFNDVYYDLPQNLREQMKEMEEHIEKYKQFYPLKNFQKS